MQSRIVRQQTARTARTQDERHRGRSTGPLRMIGQRLTNEEISNLHKLPVDADEYAMQDEDGNFLPLPGYDD